MNSGLSNNVIVFPKQNVVSNSKSANMEEIQHNIEMMRHYHIQETILNLTPMIFNQLDVAGFGLSEDGDDDVKDGAFIVEALRSFMCKYYELDHPFQRIADAVFEQKPDEEGTFRIVDKLNIQLKDESQTEE